MAPITLFFGANSSGKSSIGQLLMMLKQTAESSDRKAVLYPGGNNSAVQLGAYRDMVFHHDLNNKISFTYRWSFPDDLNFKDPVSNQMFEGNELTFTAEIAQDEKEQATLMLENLHYELYKNGESSLSVGMEKKIGLKSQYKVESSNYTLKRKTGRVWDIEAPVRFYGFPDEVVAYYQNADFVQLLNLQHEKLFRSLSYLGPLRTKADRLYSWAGIEPESVGYDGKSTVAAILAARGRRRMNLGLKKATKSFEEMIAYQLKQMNLIEEMTVKEISKKRQEYEVKVKAKGAIDWVDLPDVGFGISQVLPVLVQCFYAPQNAIILMEQPEIHLHPSAQSALADVMIDVIKSRENGTDRGVQLIIETHSEHFLRRLQRRVAEGVLEPKDIAAYFADITQTPAQLKPLDVDLYGNILNWPDNFFGDEMEDITAQSKAAIHRKKQQARKNSEAQK
jgi:predicted ATPase